MKKDFVSLQQFSAKQLSELVALSAKIKRYPAKYRTALKGKCVGLLFEKPSLRTKTAFYVGALQLGADAIYYTPQEVKVGEREKVSDVARTVSGYLDAVVLRTFSHETVLAFAQYADVPVINGLSDRFHPSQVLADLLTIQECKGAVDRCKFVYVGDGNNVCHSLLNAFARLGGHIVIASPAQYAPDQKVMNDVSAIAQQTKAQIVVTADVQQAVSEADVIYTDVWTSMGEEQQQAAREKAFAQYQINAALVSAAKPDCIVMHCLPAHRGQEITDEVVDGKQSVVFEQAHNRLHAAKAILVDLITRQ